MSDLSTFPAKKPDHADETITRLGARARGLLVKYQAFVEPRLPTGTAAELEGDLAAVGGALPGPIVAHAEAGTASASQHVLLGRGARVTRSVRRLIHKAKAPRNVKKAYGVGVRLDAKSPKSVLAGLTLIQNRAAEVPAEPATLGVTQDDVDAVKQLITDIGTAFSTRVQKRAAAPAATRKRNQLLNRILHDTGLVSAAGQAAFRESPTIAQEFAALAPPPIPKKKSARKPVATKPATPPPAAPAAPEAATEAKETPAPAKDTPAAAAGEAPANDATKTPAVPPAA